MPVKGTCKLCRRDDQWLQDSHILPKSAHTRLRAAPENPITDPVLISGGTAVSTSQQIEAHLLCSDCEQHIGWHENAVMQICIQTDDSFPALSMVTKLLESAGGPQRADGSSLPGDDLGYFALGVLCRLSVARLPGSVRIGDRYEEVVCAYLNGETEISATALVAIQIVGQPAGKASWIG